MTSLADASGWPLASASEKLDSYGERILEAAHARLLEFGLRKTSLADIASAAGVSERTLYRRFADRDALLRTLVGRQISALMARVDHALEGIDEDAERLVTACVVFARTLREHDLLQRLLITDRDTLLPFLTTEAGPILTMAQMWIAGTAGDADLVADRDQIAELLARVAHSLVLTPTTLLPFEDDEQAAALARTLFVPLVTGRRVKS